MEFVRTEKQILFLKRFTAESFYKLLNKMGVEVVYNHADYRLLSSRILHELANFHDSNLFLRGMIPLIGFKSSKIYYGRQERFAGQSHYPLSKMLSLTIDGITSLSYVHTFYYGFGLYGGFDKFYRNYLGNSYVFDGKKYFGLGIYNLCCMLHWWNTVYLSWSYW